jgi:ABC-2 type transport system permease protein
MLNDLRLYGRYLSASVQGQMQYRVSFLLQCGAYLLVTGMEFLGILVLFNRFGTLRGWTLHEVALFYGMINIAFALAEAAGRGFDIFPRLVKSGDFDRLLLRPRSTALQVAGQELQLMRAGRLAQGIAILLWSLSGLDVSWSPAKGALLLFAVLGGAALFYGIFILTATLSFWTVESLEIANILTNGSVETAQYPLTLYRPGFRRFFTFVVPLACVNYFPAHALLDRPDPLGSPGFLHWLSPLVGVLFLLAALQAWNLGVRHYRSTGS